MFVYIRSTAIVIVVTQKLVLQQSKSVTAKCTENLLLPPCILYLLEVKCVCGYCKIAVSCLSDYLGLSVKSKIRLPIPQFYHFMGPTHSPP